MTASESKIRFTQSLSDEVAILNAVKDPRISSSVAS